MGKVDAPHTEGVRVSQRLPQTTVQKTVGESLVQAAQELACRRLLPLAAAAAAAATATAACQAAAAHYCHMPADPGSARFMRVLHMLPCSCSGIQQCLGVLPVLAERSVEEEVGETRAHHAGVG